MEPSRGTRTSMVLRISPETANVGTACKASSFAPSAANTRGLILLRAEVLGYLIMKTPAQSLSAVLLTAIGVESRHATDVVAGYSNLQASYANTYGNKTGVAFPGLTSECWKPASRVSVRHGCFPIKSREAGILSRCLTPGRFQANGATFPCRSVNEHRLKALDGKSRACRRRRMGFFSAISITSRIAPNLRARRSIRDGVIPAEKTLLPPSPRSIPNL